MSRCEKCDREMHPCDASYSLLCGRCGGQFHRTDRDNPYRVDRFEFWLDAYKVRLPKHIPERATI